MKLSDNDLRSLATRLGSPLYVYSRDTLVQNIAAFRRFLRWPKFHLLFATMANPSEEMLSIIFQENVGACVNSQKHLTLCLDLGCPNHMIQFTSTGMTQGDMCFLIKNNIACNADSQKQAESWFKLSGRRIGLRVNAASLNPTELNPDRLGICSKELPEVVHTLESSGGMVDGLHVYLGTNFLNCEVMLRTLESFLGLAHGIPNLRYVNIGGGVGVDYGHRGAEFPLERFGQGIDQMLEDLGRDITLYFEPGRSLVAKAGSFIVTVTDVKCLSGKRYVCVDGSVAQFPRPLHHPETPHKVRVLSKRYESPLHPASVVGRTTFSRDVLAPDAQLPTDVEVGDFLVFEDAGAYCSSMASRFLGQPEVTGVVV